MHFDYFENDYLIKTADASAVVVVVTGCGEGVMNARDHEVVMFTAVVMVR